MIRDPNDLSAVYASMASWPCYEYAGYMPALAPDWPVEDLTPDDVLAGGASEPDETGDRAR